MNNLNIKYQLPSGEWHILPLNSQQIIEALIEKAGEGVLPILVTCIEITSNIESGKVVRTTLLNNIKFDAVSEII